MKFGQKALLSSALVGAAIAGGAVGASVLGTAQAQTSSSSSSTTAASDPSTAPAAGHGPHTANGITETPLTGDDLSKATAAAQAAVPGATIERAETDAEGAAYEVHVTKSDGSESTVKLDTSFTVTSIEDGRA